MSLTTLEQRSGRLPAEMTSFIGRGDELAEIERLFERCRLVTLMGPGGVGKTRLAIRSASLLRESFDDGVCFVDLAGLREPGLLAQAVGEAFGLPDQAPAVALNTLVHYLSGRRALLILDTCEHLIDGCAMLAEVLLRNAPGLRIMATSRQPFDVTGEYTVVVAPLAVPRMTPGEPAVTDPALPIPSVQGGAGGPGAEPCDSMTLFAERASAVASGWSLTEENFDVVALLCNRLDGIPLAIELTAVQLRALSVEQVVDRLGRRTLRLGGRRSSMSRHQTLSAAIEWSHELCSPGERLLWARLSVFAAAFELEDAEHVCADDRLPAEQVCDLLTGLVAQSIVLRVDGEGAARYRMLDSIREYGAERLEELGEAETVRKRLFDRFSGAVQRAWAELGTEAQTRWLRWFRREQANVRNAMEYGLRVATDEDLARMCLGFGRILALQGLIGEARYWYGRALSGRDLHGLDIPESAEVLALAGLLAVLQVDLDSGRELVEEGERRVLAAGDDVRGLAYVREVQGVAALNADRLEEAIDRLSEAARLHEQARNDDVLVPIGDVFLAATCALAGLTEEARRYVTRLVRRLEEAGEVWCRSYGLCVLGLTLALAGEPDRALAELRAGLRMKRDLDDRLGIALALDMAGLVLVGLGDAMAAARMSGAADATLRFSGVSLFGPKHHELRALYTDQAKQVMGEETFRKAYESGAGLPLDAAIREALGEPLPAGPGGQGPGAGGDQETPLTRRELEIAGLVAEGLTNREIATRLVIAKRTADSHVEHILSKLSFTSRAQIAAWYSQLP